jgi:DNA-binding MarR family transcriptional regulator
MENSDVSRLALTERQYFLLLAILNLPAPDRFASRVAKEADAIAKRHKPSNPAPQHNALNRLEQFGLITSERDANPSNRGLPRRWLSITSKGHAAIEYFKDYKFQERYAQNESTSS